ncbi:hypothetical protein ACLBVR_20500, partial [Pseudomonas aeruginosa]|uniref:hypothetical protein n=1 Tax=Pseudomonas aeruginosa TaxID=287 RepID=UPI0039692259
FRQLAATGCREFAQRLLGRNRGGTLDEAGMQFANRACWGNVLAACARLMEVPRTALLTPEEAAAVAGKGDPALLR